MAEVECVAELRGHEDRVWCAAWAPGGGALATCGGDGSVRVWAAAAPGGEWRVQQVLDGVHTRTVRRVAWSPTGRMLATCSFDGTTAVWACDAAGGDFECVATLEGHENEVKAVAWSPSGQLLATCSRDKSVWVWEAAPGNEFDCVSVLHGHQQDVKSVRWAPDGSSLVSASYDNTLRVWGEDGDDWTAAGTLEAHGSTVWDFCFDGPGRRIVSCGDDRRLVLWKRGAAAGAAWERAAAVEGAHERTVFSVAWHPAADVVATGGADDAFRLWRVDGDRALAQAHVQAAAHAADVNCVAWSPAPAPARAGAADGAPPAYLLATAGDDMVVRVWRVAV